MSIVNVTMHVDDKHIAVGTDKIFVSQIFDFQYVHTQSNPSATWTINHNLGRYVVAEVIDTSGTVVIGAVTSPTINQTIIYFNSAMAGKAILI